MKVLVIGATGYVGSHVAQRMLSEGHSVVGSARDEAGAARVAKLGASPIKADLDDLGTFDDALLEADCTIYAAQLLLEPEHEVMAALLDRLAGSDKTLIFTSGTGVLGQKTDGDWSEDSFAEEDDFIPSKWLVRRVETEALIRDAAHRGVRAMVLRPPMIWGNGGCGLIRGFYESAAQTGTVCYVGRGLNLYSNVHVEDLADAYALAASKGRAGALYHCVAGEVAHRTLAERVAQQLGCATRSVDFEEAARIWGKFRALIIMSSCSRTRSPGTRSALNWEPRHLDMLSEVPHPAYRID